MKTQTLLTLASTLISTSALTACAALSPNQSSSPSTHPSEAQMNTAKIHVFESDANGFNTKTVFYDNGQEVVAFDAQFTPDQARKAIAYLRTQTQNPIRYLVITHPNPDKFNGLSVFREAGATVVASRKTVENMSATHDYKKYFFVKIAKMFTDETYPKLAKPDQIFDHELRLDLKGGDRIELRELSNPGVSTNQTVAFIPEAKALIVGDLIHHKAHAWLEGGIVNGKATPTLAGWIEDLKELRSLYGDRGDVIVYGGRGQTAPLNEAVATEIRYLEKADRLVNDYVASLGDRKNELLGPDASKHAAELASVFEGAFPGYDLGYMIQYGAYGLVNSKL